MFESKDLEYHKNKLYGLYRGYVYDNKDPQHQGRIKAEIPNVYGIDDDGSPLVTDWFYPCYPIAGNGWGMNFVPPTKNPDGSKVMIWVEFEMGDKDKPVFMGCPIQMNGLQEVALKNSKDRIKGKQNGCVFTFTTPKGNKIILNDETGEITIDAKKEIKISTKECKLLFTKENDVSVLNKNGKIDLAKNGDIKISNKNGKIDLLNDGILNILPKEIKINSNGGVLNIKDGKLSISANDVKINSNGGNISFGSTGTITINKESFPV